MHRWCAISGETLVESGQFLEAELYSRSARSLEGDSAFINALAERLMLRYEGQPNPPLLSFDDDLIDKPERSRHYYRRLFNENGDYSDDFAPWVGEILAHWMEESLEGAFYAWGNPPHSNDPAYDVIVLLATRPDAVQLRLVQAKATRDDLQGNCNVALRKFERFERGDYLAELMNRLHQLKEMGRLPSGVEPRELIFQQGRHYRITVLHAEDRDAMQILTTYNEKIPGPIDRRSVRLAGVEDWGAFLRELAGVIYARLA